MLYYQIGRLVPWVFGVLSITFLAAACTSVLSPKLDEATGTTLAQRCVDYRATMATLAVAGGQLNPAYIAAASFVAANCPPLEPVLEPPAAPEGVG